MRVWWKETRHSHTAHTENEVKIQEMLNNRWCPVHEGISDLGTVVKDNDRKTIHTGWQGGSVSKDVYQQEVLSLKIRAASDPLASTCAHTHRNIYKHHVLQNHKYSEHLQGAHSTTECFMCIVTYPSPTKWPFSLLCYFILDAWLFCLHIDLYTTHAHGALKGQILLRTGVKDDLHYVGVGNWSPLEELPVLLTAEGLFSLLKTIF